MQRRNSQKGFTIVELLIVIVVIGILAAITVVAYNGVQQKAQTAKRDADVSMYVKAINLARINTDKVLSDITNSKYSVGNCLGTNNPSGVEPRDLPKTHQCWTRYYDNLSKIGAAASVNLDSLKGGDARGNPYALDENEGETCSDDQINGFTGNGISMTRLSYITRTAPC